MYYSAIRSLYRHMVCNVPVFSKVLTEIEISWGAAGQWPKNRLILARLPPVFAILLEEFILKHPHGIIMSFRIFLIVYSWSTLIGSKVDLDSLKVMVKTVLIPFCTVSSIGSLF